MAITPPCLFREMCRIPPAFDVVDIYKCRLLRVNGVDRIKDESATLKTLLVIQSKRFLRIPGHNEVTDLSFMRHAEARQPEDTESGVGSSGPLETEIELTAQNTRTVISVLEVEAVTLLPFLHRCCFYVDMIWMPPNPTLQYFIYEKDYKLVLRTDDILVKVVV